MDNGERLTLVKILHFLQCLIHELDVGCTAYLAFSNLITELVEDYHLYFGIRTRTMVQQIVYAAGEIPGDFLELAKAKSEILSRLERDHLKVSGKVPVLQYTVACQRLTCQKLTHFVKFSEILKKAKKYVFLQFCSHKCSDRSLISES